MSNNSGNKAHQTIKFYQVIKYYMGNIFVKKSYAKCCRKTIPRLFPEKSNISLDQESKDLYCLFLLHAKLRATKIYFN